MTTNALAPLVEAIRSDIDNLRQVGQEAAANRADFADKAPETLRDLRGIAGNLSDIYQGAENIFSRIARATGEGTPSGREWHRDLLEQMVRELPGVRPAVIRDTTRSLLDVYRSFRHLLRHRYGFDLEWEDMKPLVAAAEDTLAELIGDLEAFADNLEHMAQDQS